MRRFRTDRQHRRYLGVYRQCGHGPIRPAGSLQHVQEPQVSANGTMHDCCRLMAALVCHISLRLRYCQIKLAKRNHGVERIPSYGCWRRLLLSRCVHTEIPERFH